MKGFRRAAIAAAWAWCAIAFAAEGTTPQEYAAYAETARKADAIGNAEARCLAYPDLPGNTWAAGSGSARCAVLRGPMLSLAEINALLDRPDGPAQLDARYRALMEAHFKDPAQREQIFLSMWVFSEFAAAKPIAERWLAAAPESPFARTAMAMVLTHAGWDARGGALIRDTPAASIDAMDRFFAQAIPHLGAALAAEPKLLPACYTLATIGRMSSAELQASALAHCLKYDDASWWIVQEMALDAEPRWGGSLEAMRFTDAYAQARVARNATLAPLTVKQAGYEAARSNDRKQHLEVLKPLALRAPNAPYIKDVGFALIASNDPWAAFARLSQARRYLPDDTIVAGNLAMALGRIGDRPWALRVSKWLVERAPDDTQARLLLAENTWHVEGAAAARPHYELAMRDAAVRESAYASLCRTWVPKAPREEKSASAEWVRAYLQCTDAYTREYPGNGDAWSLRYGILAHLNDPKTADAARRFLATMDAKRWPDHASLAEKLRVALRARGEPLE